MLDLSIYAKAAIGGVPILFLVFGLVQILKLLKRADGGQAVTGNGLTLSSCLIGLALGVLFIMSQQRPISGPDWWPVFVYWFAAVAYGLGLGILASLFWDALKKLAEDAVQKLLQQLAQNADLAKPPPPPH